MKRLPLLPTSEKFRRLRSILSGLIPGSALRSPAGMQRRARADAEKRRGAVLIVVLMLMILLLFLGITWFTFANTEHSSSTYFADAAKTPYSEVTLDADMVFNFALEQLIVGTNREQSALYPGLYSLVPTAIGHLNYNTNANAGTVGQPLDWQTFNGKGVNIISKANGAPEVDQDLDGVADGDQTLLNMNFSRAATGNTINSTQLAALPHFDVDYTYPDQNNPFLAYTAVVNGKQVVIPSFHRPAALRNTTTGAAIPDWYNNTSAVGSPNHTATRVFRPHPSHFIVGTGTPRFLSAATSGVNPFPFAVDAGSNGTNGEQGVWSNPANPTNLDYDVDPTGYGFRCGVWLDLDFPKQKLPDGRIYVPLISFHVIDGDGLVNLNTTGNLPPMADRSYPSTSDPQTRMSFTQPIGGSGQSLHASNQGMDPTEINPTWPLTADPTDIPGSFATTTTRDAALQQYRGFFGGNPTTAIELANMDHLNMLLGRPHYSVTGTSPSEVFTLNELKIGRWGEENALFNGVTSSPRNPSAFPRPGVRATSNATQMANSPTDLGDDNLDRYIGRPMDDYGGWLTPDSLLPGVILPGFVHPLDWSGRGTFTQTGTYGRVPMLQGDPNDAANPSTWLKYQNYQGGVRYNAALSNSALNQTSTIYANVDHSNEITVDPKYKSPSDRIFGPEESAIHLSQSDFSKTGLSSRLRQLLSANFDANLKAADIRQKFTVASWDRRQHNFSYNLRRPWEFNADVNADGHLEFPPVFVTATGNATFVNSLGQTLSKEPFRAEVVAQMGAERDNSGMATIQRQLRLELNRLCVIDDSHLPTTNSSYRRDQITSTLLPRFRSLTPHPSLSQTGDNAVIPTTASYPPPAAPMTGNYPTPDDPNTAGGRAAQEYWARVDRQRLARDIYVLLYTLGGGQDGLAFDATNGVNYADITGASLANNTPRTATTGPLYNDTQLQVMAQFAVNVVDALDGDNVITKFEYDKNLGDGWNLGDNPYSTADDDPSIPNADRGIVWGVEAQLLTFSEVLAFISKKDATTDFACTTYDDRTQDHPYMFVELRNTSPFTQSWNNGAWRIRRVSANPLIERRLVIRTASIGPGRQYTIGSQDGTDKFIDPNDGSTTIYRSSDFRVDYDQDNDGMLDGLFYRIAPNVTEASPPQAQTTPTPLPGCDLDLVHARDQAGKFTLTDGSGTSLTTPGAFMYDSANPTIVPAAGDSFVLVLERRVHLTRTAPSSGSTTEENDNPWIEVDRFGDTDSTPYLLKEFTPNSDPMMIRTQLSPLKSLERRQPFEHTTAGEVEHAADATGYKSNSIGQNTQIGGYLCNSNTTGAFNIWQPHFDRDFASVIELLALPLYGPDKVTSKLTMDGANAAATLFMRPQDPSNDGAAMPTLSKNNRWYRLLDAVEVAPRSRQQLELQLQQSLNTMGSVVIPRSPGKINLNTLRHLEVLGALIDDGMLTRPSLADSSEAGRNWWDQFLQGRDRRDPTTGLILPGSPVSKPFRNFSYTEEGIASLESTLLRRLMLDNEDVNRNGTLDAGEDANNDSMLTGSTEARRMFEARIAGDTNNTVDFSTQKRLLSKISGNTTTRSNVFMVWVTVGFFQAVETAPGGPVQIGAELSGASRYRGFFVIDRSDLENGFNQQSKKFDYSKFIIYRQTLQ